MRVRHRRGFRSLSRFASRPFTTNGFRLFWFVVIVWGELGVFYWNVSSCQWPTLDTSDTSPVHALLISDPQVVYPLSVWSAQYWHWPLRRWLLDANLRKSWYAARGLRPDAVIFLGDMLMNGKSIGDSHHYEMYARKFHRIFRMPQNTASYHIPGNNDVGMGVTANRRAREYFVSAFGPTNQKFLIKNHLFVGLDAPALVDEDYQRSADGFPYHEWVPQEGGAVSFTKSLESDMQPLVLLSHIPLSRPETASCGPLREKGAIRRGVGHGYQNTFGKETTQFLLETLKPIAVFSGDNRDYCEYEHLVVPPGQDPLNDTMAVVPETTVKSFSASRHINRPGFQLVTLADPSASRKSLADAPCLLPDQHHIHTVYLLLGLFTIVIQFLVNWNRSRKHKIPDLSPLDILPTNGHFLSPSPNSSAWSPYDLSSPVSPRGSLPLSLRTPNALKERTFQASSNPPTPLLPAIPLAEDEDEQMYHTQFTPHESRRRLFEDYDEDDGYPESSPTRPSRFVSGVLSVPSRWSWSHTFVFQGRRRRATISLPSFSSFPTALFRLFGGEEVPAEHVPFSLYTVRNTLRDGLNIWTFAISIWIVIHWVII